MDKQKETRLSKFASKVLRHDPGCIGVKLDEEGWLPVQELLDGFKRSRFTVTEEELFTMVKNNAKQRFKLSPDKSKIRASQGHSVEVELNLQEKNPPQDLYHGTGAKYLPSIMKTGLKAQSRNHVHLSKDEETATQVGSRRGKPLLLRVNAKKAAKDGIKFFESDNGVWLTDQIPAKYLSVI